MKFFKYILLVILLILAVGISVGVVSFYQKELLVQKEEKERKVLSERILEGVSIQPNALNVSYLNPVSTGSPLIFGGSHSPEVAHQDAWNKIAEIGVTSIRKDLFIERAIPNTTIADYKDNMNGVADPTTWDQNEINKISDVFKNAQSRNIKTIGILAYTPGWLTYTNTGNGVPKDWAVFEDITRKSYTIHRNNLDYIEIWNEPNFNYFFDPAGSGMTQDEAYAMMYYHASKAIREVDAQANDGKVIPIGGPVGYDPIKTSTLEKLLQNKDILKNINFISYHNYDGQHLKEPSWVNYKRVMAKYGIEDRPIFITEWNYMPDDKAPNPKNIGVDGLLYTGNKFVDFLKMGLTGANYHVLEPLNPNKPNNGEGYYGFYKWVDGTAALLQQSRTWRLFSSKMRLGKGKSTIYSVNQTDTSLNSIGFTNASGQRGLIIVNDSSSPQMATLNLADTGIKNYAKVTMYYASADNEAKIPVYEGHVKSIKDAINLLVYIPKESIVGIALTEEKEWFDIFNIGN